MLDKNLESEYAGEDRLKPLTRSTRIPLAYISFVTLMVLFPFGLAAQTGPSPAQGGIGTGVQTPLRFGGESAPNNLASIGLGVSALYDDNVLSNGAQRVSDEAVSLTSLVNIFRQTEHMTINFGYTPFLTLYRQYSQFNRVNHSANLSMSFRLTPRFTLGMQDTFTYLNGIYPSFTSQQILSGPISLTGLNQTIVPPTTRTLSNTSGLELTFAKSNRTSLTLSGGYSQQKFGGQAGTGQPLYNSRGFSGGVQYQYRVTEHTSLGLVGMHQDATFNGGEIFGSNLRSQSESAFVSLTSEISPTVSLTFFGGPQYIRSLGATSPGGSIGAHLQGAGGGSITKEVRRTALNLSVQRAVSTGGGLYAQVEQTSANLGIRRRLVGRWEVGVQGTGGINDASLFQGNSSKIESLSGGISFSRPLGSGTPISESPIHRCTS